MKYLSTFILLLLMTGCNSPISSIEGLIENVHKYSIEVNCSNAVNREKKGDIPSIAYVCNVKVTEDTLITDSKGKPITIEDLHQGQTVNVVFNEKVDISVNKTDVTATEIKVIK
ncbi:hypothetical protein UACE39S_00623 [Ureibacillus acetophenoni]